MGGFGPRGLMVAARSGELETGAVLQPLVAQFVETGRRDQEPFGGGEGVEPAVVEGRENFLNEERGNAVSELLFFIAAKVACLGGAAPPKFIALRPWLRRVQRASRSGFSKR